MIRIIAALSLALLAATASAQGTGGPENRPWAAVGRLTFEGQFICTATLISETAILTAAHCVLDDDGQPHPMEALGFQAGVVGNSAVVVREIAGIHVHPDYRPALFADRATTSADLAMLDLGWPVGAHEVLPIAVGTWGGDARGLLLPSYGRGHEAELRIETGCTVDATDGPVLRLLCVPTEGASGAPLVAGYGAARRVVAVLSNARRGFSPRAFAVRTDRALASLAGLR